MFAGGQRQGGQSSAGAALHRRYSQRQLARAPPPTPPHPPPHTHNTTTHTHTHLHLSLLLPLSAICSDPLNWTHRMFSSPPPPAAPSAAAMLRASADAGAAWALAPHTGPPEHSAMDAAAGPSAGLSVAEMRLALLQGALQEVQQARADSARSSLDTGGRPGGPGLEALNTLPWGSCAAAAGWLFR
jgi:hypothetical protein